MSIRIVHISDLHYESPPESFFPGVGKSLERSAPLIKKQAADLVLCSGDVTSHGSVNPDELHQAKHWLDQLVVPYLIVPGNHDQGANRWRSEKFPDTELYEDVPFDRTRFGRVFGTPPVVVRDLGPVLVVGFAARHADPDHTLGQLAQVLSSAAKPVIVFGHYPVVPTREDGALKEFGCRDFVPELAVGARQLFVQHPWVRLYLCGHVHASTMHPIGNNCLQLSTGALGPGPSLFRTVEVDSHGLTWETHFGGGSLRFWGTEDVEYYLGGPEERAGSWSLT